MIAYINSSTVPMTQPKANGNVFSFDYAIKEINVAANHRVMDALGRFAKHSRSSIGLHSAIAS